MKSKTKICAGIITYNPKVESLKELLKILENEADGIVVVDNGSANGDVIFDLLRQSFSDIYFIRNSENRGIATGMNQAAFYAEKQRFDFIWTFDQDSRPEVGLRHKLESAFYALSQGRRVAAVGPCHKDLRTGEREPFVKFRLPRNRHLLDNCKEDFIECDFLISSGCLIPLKVLRDIGFMEDALFIDNVDLEWCFRARYNDYCLFGIKNALMCHCIGDRQIHLPVFGERIRFHEPSRTYYMTRNRILLYRRRYIPWAWKVHDVNRFVFKIMASLLLSSKRKEHLFNFRRGVYDALKGHDLG
jgi:rhamnosyltransferase